MFQRYRLPILAGLLVGTSYIPFPPWDLFFCLVPLWIFTLRAKSLKEAFWGGWLTQFLLNAIGFHWIAYTAVEFGHFPWIVGVLVLIGFCVIAHLYFPASTALWFWLNRRYNFKPLPAALLLATLFLIFQYSFPVLFPWHFGYPWLWAGFPGVQSADIIGFEGLNILTVFINALVLQAWLMRSHRRQLMTYAGVAIALFAAVNIVGLARKNSWPKPDAEIKVLAVQGNIGNWEKVMVEKGNNFQSSIVTRFADLSKKGLQENPTADVLLWPETAFPDYLDDHRGGDKEVIQFKNFLREVQKPIMTGGYSTDIRQLKTYNGFFVLDKDGNWPSPPYHKTLLLAFGEYFPGADYFPFIMKLFPDQSAFGRGEGPMAMQLGEWRIGPQICYEGLYPWFSAGLAREGAEIFANVTNDSWFGKPFEPNQHLYMTLARAIEFRRPLVRSTNTGITTAILADGTILQKSPIHEAWTGMFTVPYLKTPPLTLYTYFEPYWIWILVLTAIALVALGRSKAYDKPV